MVSEQSTAQSEAPPTGQDGVPSSSRERQREASLRIILEAAGRVFGERGFDGATLREVADCAGVKQPLVVYYFKSKEGLWRATVGHLFTRMIAAVREDSGWAEVAESPAVIRAVLRSFVRVVAEEPAWLQILLREASQPGPRLDWLVENHSRYTYEAGLGFLESAQQRGLLPDLPAQHLLYILVGALTFVLAIAPEVRAVTGETATDDAFLDRHVDTFIALLFPDLQCRGRLAELS